MSLSPVNVDLESWQLVGFSLSVGPNDKNPGGSIFAETGSSQNFVFATGGIDFSTVKFLRVGGSTTSKSWLGDISGLRIMTPGSSYLSTCELYL